MAMTDEEVQGIASKLARISRPAESTPIMTHLSLANQRFHNTRRPLIGSYFAQRGEQVVRVDGTDPDDVAFFANLGFAQTTGKVCIKAGQYALEPIPEVGNVADPAPAEKSAENL